MTTDLDEKLLRELARPVVARLAPAEDELLFPLLSDAYFDDPAAFAAGTARPGPLAFGLPEATVLLTPLVLAALTEAVQYAVGQGMAAGARVSGRALRRLFRSRQRPRPAALDDGDAPGGDAPDNDAPEGSATESAPDVSAAGAENVLALTPAQWTEIGRIVERTARRGGAEADLARLIAAAVVGEGLLGAGPDRDDPP